ncbi:MAG: lipopolysaccharide biosynthesis protein [Bryobacteraceae bacterium]
MSRRAYISTFGATALVIALTMVTSVIIARNLGPEGRGVLLAVTIWPGLLMSFLGGGLNEATTYHLARASLTEGGGATSRYAGSGLVLQAAVALIATPLTLALIPFLLKDAYGSWLGIALFYAVAFGLLTPLDQHFKAVLQGDGRFNFLSAVRIGQPIIYASLLLGCVVARLMSVEAVLAAMVASSAVSVVSGAVLAGVSVCGITRDAMRDTLWTGLRFHVGNMLMAAAGEADKLIVLALLDITSVGYYAVAVALSPLGTVSVVQSLGIILTRDMARSTSSSGRAGVFAANLLGALLMLFAVNGLAVVSAPWWLPVLYGSSFAGAVPVAAILFVTGAVKGLRQITDRAMRAMHITWVGVAGEAVALALTVVLAYLGGKAGGLTGVAWALVVSQGVALTVMLGLAMRAIGVAPTEFASRIFRDAARLPGLARREAMLVRELLR